LPGCTSWTHEREVSQEPVTLEKQKMIRFNPHRNVLMREEHDMPLINPSEPRLYRDTFPYEEPPRISFNFRLSPMMPPDEIWITDTTFRDGQQSRPPYTPRQIADLYEFLHHLGGPKGIIRQSEFFLYSDKDKEAVRLCLEKGYKYPEITGWIRAKKSDFKLVKQMGLKETGILTSASDYHIYLKLRKDRKGAIEQYMDIVRAALEEGIRPRCHMEDITRADFYGFVVPFAQELMALSSEYDTPVKIRVCDTLGYGVPYPGAMLPRSVPGLIYGLTHFAGVPDEWLEWHGHNDFCKVLINASTAWLYGCCAANGSLLGLGERTGNPPIEALVFEYMMLRGTEDGMDPSVITEIARYYETEVGYSIPHNQPFVGKDFNITRAGIHADGLMKNEEIYNAFDTDRLLNRAPGIAVTDKSGAAGILAWAKVNVPDERAEDIDKTHPGIGRIVEAVQTEYDDGRVTAISDEEMLAYCTEYMPELFSQQQGD